MVDPSKEACPSSGEIGPESPTLTQQRRAAATQSSIVRTRITIVKVTVTWTMRPSSPRPGKRTERRIRSTQTPKASMRRKRTMRKRQSHRHDPDVLQASLWDSQPWSREQAADEATVRERLEESSTEARIRARARTLARVEGHSRLLSVGAGF